MLLEHFLTLVDVDRVPADQLTHKEPVRPHTATDRITRSGLAADGQVHDVTEKVANLRGKVLHAVHHLSIQPCEM